MVFEALLGDESNDFDSRWAAEFLTAAGIRMPDGL